MARYIAELANLPMRNDQPYVGHSAFAHKGGVHVSAVLKDSATYEHIKPESVGNRQRVLLSDLSGRGNVLYKLKQHGLAERLDSDARRELLDRIKQMEHQGYELEAAEGTFELLVREALHPGLNLFEVVELRSRDHDDPVDETQTTATVTLARPGQRPHRDRNRSGSHERARPLPAPVPLEGLSADRRTSA